MSPPPFPVNPASPPSLIQPVTLATTIHHQKKTHLLLLLFVSVVIIIVVVAAAILMVFLFQNLLDLNFFLTAKNLNK